jgi:uncharacterized protein (DUF2252 family)
VDMARKVVGVGSVGTRTFIVLLLGHAAQDALLLQIAEATALSSRPTCLRAATGSTDSGVVEEQRMRLDNGVGGCLRMFSERDT